MSMDDYFTKNLYKGKIYKTNNMLGKTLAQYCPTDSAMIKEQKRIEKELTDFEHNLWGSKQGEKMSLDSLAQVHGKNEKKSTKKNRRAGSSSASSKTKTAKVKKSRPQGSSSSSSGSARVTVRRQRH